MGRGARGKRFAKGGGILTAVFRNRLSARPTGTAFALLAVNPLHQRVGDQHWRTPYQKRHPTRGSRHCDRKTRQGHKARRRKGVTRTRPEDRS